MQQQKDDVILLRRYDDLLKEGLQELGHQIRANRITMNMTQKEFAEYMGVSTRMVRRWESGKYNFTIKSLYSLCDRLDLPLNIQIGDFKL